MSPDVIPTRHSLRILHVEDSQLDADLTVARLRRAGIQFEACRVDTEEQFLNQLDCHRWDLVLADYNLPSFSGLRALELCVEKCPNMPFIFVSGVLGEEVAIDTLKTGATDYVLKDRLDRLVPAIQRAMAEAEERRQRQEAQAALLKSESRLRAALIEAEQANAAKDHFLAVLSHELRTPLAPILTTTQILVRDPSLNEAYREQIAVIKRNAELEARLIDDLLDLTRIVRGKLQLETNTVDVHELLDGVIAICQDDLQAKHQNLHREYTATTTAVPGDSARLQQILWNLLKNAIKFTPDGGAIRIVTRNLADDRLEVCVEDTGIGIDAAALPRIFIPFEQADTSVTRRFGGLGLGLSIAKLLAEKHGGLLVARSDGHNKGSTFILTLPTTGAAKQTPAPAPTAPPSVRPLYILLVEDHGDTLNAMSQLLKMLGHKVDTAMTVHEAVGLLGNSRFDLLISDIGLPDGSGLDVVRAWCQRHRDRPSIALTGFGMDHDIDQCRTAGFSQHLTKPVNFEKLESVIESFESLRK